GLPLILDDVFVNFDAKRAQYAAETICEFAAAGHQVLVFTCHDHIRDVFHRLGVDLRELPNAQEIADHPEPVLSSPAYVEPVVAAPIIVEEPELVELDAALPDEGDADLDHELIYGAPEYDPGHGLPELVPAIVDVLEEEAELVPAPAPVAKPRRVKRRPAKRQPPAVTPAPTYPVQMPTTVVAAPQPVFITPPMWTPIDYEPAWRPEYARPVYASRPRREPVFGVSPYDELYD
ncbi:MAG: hypothetical protein KDB23_28515, partial [Planctomycetales bacterium]|nr:hypothetical protein [Planctomycetales bacterium]